MSSNYTKIQSNQSGPFTQQANLVDFNIPPNVYDFSKSYVELNTNIVVTDTDNTAGEGIFNFFGSMNNFRQVGGGDDEICHNIGIVKNAHLRNEAKGVLENIRRVDKLRTNLFNYTKTDEEKHNENWNALGSAPRSTDFMSSPYTELKGYEDDNSSYRNNVLRIPLNHIYNLGNLTQYDGNRYGMTTAHLELQPEQIRMTQVLGDADGLWAEQRRTECLNIDAGTPVITSLVTSVVYPDLKMSPFWVGQKITVTCVGSDDGAGAAPANINAIRRITRIHYDGIGNSYGNNLSTRLVITLNATIGATLAQQSYNTVRIVGRNATAVINISHINLVLNIPINPNPPPSITYTTWNVEEDHAGNINTFKKMYEIEPECRSVMICESQGQASISSIQSYRFRIDNVEVSDRDIVYNSSSHRDLIVRMLENAGEPVKCLREVYYDSIADADFATYNVKPYGMIGCPTPITENPKLLHIEMNSAGGLNFISIFKEVVRSI